MSSTKFGRGALQQSDSTNWINEALVKTIVGTVLGLITALAVVTVSSTVAPGLKDFGYDLGLRLNVAIDRVVHSAASGAPTVLGQTGETFMFLDIDPEFGKETKSSQPGSQRHDPSAQACAALASALPSRYSLHNDNSGGESGSNRAALNCADARPVNRYLLAEIVDQLSRWNPRAIVIDLILANEAGVVPEAEDDALRKVVSMRADSTLKIPIVWIDPLRIASSPGTLPIHVHTVGRPLLRADPTRSLYNAAAFPISDQTIRRFPKCVLKDDLPEEFPSAPFLLSRILAHDTLGSVTICKHGTSASLENAPRIVYTLPTARGHQDNIWDDARPTWAYYRTVFNRCLAASFWDITNSECARAAAYKNRIVVIGTTNPNRRDRHYTPLGEMAGSEVIINATRSFMAFPENNEKPFVAVLQAKTKIVLLSALVWLVYFLAAERLKSRSQVPERIGILRLVGSAFLFAFAIGIVCCVAFSLSFAPDRPAPSVDIFIPVLAIALDVYVESTRWIIEKVESVLKEPSTRGH